MIPTEFVGAWQRVAMRLGDGPMFESAHVVWLQGRSAYADLRVPLDGGRDGLDCFAGHTSWAPPTLRWSHDIDLAGGPAAVTDVGNVRWSDDGDLVETGVFEIDGADVPYLEVWRRQPAATARVVEITDTGYAHVEVGEHALTVVDERAAGGELSACYRRCGDVVVSIGGRAGGGAR